MGRNFERGQNCNSAGPLQFTCIHDVVSNNLFFVLLMYKMRKITASNELKRKWKYFLFRIIIIILLSLQMLQELFVHHDSMNYNKRTFNSIKNNKRDVRKHVSMSDVTRITLYTTYIHGL